MLCQQLLVTGILFQLVLQHLHLFHGAEHRRKGTAHLTIHIQGRVQLAVLFQIAQGYPAADLVFTLIGLVLTTEYLEQGGFAGTIFTHDTNALTLFHRGVDIMQDHSVAKAFS